LVEIAPRQRLSEPLTCRARRRLVDENRLRPEELVERLLALARRPVILGRLERAFADGVLKLDADRPPLEIVGGGYVSSLQRSEWGGAEDRPR
jgi:hypothetical protein